MPKQEVLKPQDVAVALRLAQVPEASYVELGADLSMSPSTAHKSVERLQLAGLLLPDSRRVNRHYLMEFLEHGVKFMFPAKLDVVARGVPTAHSGPALANEFIADDKIVWADGNGNAVGQSMTPLYRKAAKLVSNCPSVYELLTLVDAIRIGRARERTTAMEKIRERLPRAA